MPESERFTVPLAPAARVRLCLSRATVTEDAALRTVTASVRFRLLEPTLVNWIGFDAGKVRDLRFR